MRPLEDRAAQKGLAMAWEVDPEVPGDVLGDPGHLAQILVNLAGNAIKFTSRGRVALRVRLTSQTTEVTELEFTVSDTGVGLGRAGDGPGTGLSTLRERLQLAFGGDAQLTLTSLVPHGARAVLDFPAQPSPP